MLFHADVENIKLLFLSICRLEVHPKQGQEKEQPSDTPVRKDTVNNTNAQPTSFLKGNMIKP